MEASNMAAMREALKEADKVLSATSYGFDAPIRAQIRKVLSAPPRNCDRFDDLKSAQRHYIEHGCQKGLGMIVDGEIRKSPWKSQFEKWLFAPATEQKGEPDGSK